MSQANTENASSLANASSNTILIVNLLAMMVTSLASPWIYYDPEPVTAWLVVWTGPLVLAAVFFILAKVVMPARIAQNGQKTFFKYAWVFLALFLVSHWQEYGSAATNKQSAQPQTFSFEEASTPAPSKPSFEFDPSTARPTSVESAPLNTAPVNRQMTIDEFLADAPGQR